MNEKYHIPVLLEEVQKYLRVKEGGLYIDCTLGGGGHARGILEQGGSVVGIDRDPEAVDFAAKALQEYGDRFEAHASRFSHIETIAGSRAGSIDGVLMDLGVSSRMIDNAARGFSFQHNGPLLMTMGENDQTAIEVINTHEAKDLAELFRRYGEERYAKIIADSIVKIRSLREITTTTELADIIEDAVGKRKPQKSKARVFQALRIYVNDELGELRKGLAGALDVMREGGRLLVIAYHSLEDRIVKRCMREEADPCLCPKDLPECRCGRTPRLKLVTNKIITPSEEEVERNVRARSAKMRVAEKIGQ